MKTLDNVHGGGYIVGMDTTDHFVDAEGEKRTTLRQSATIYPSAYPDRYLEWKGEIKQCHSCRLEMPAGFEWRSHVRSEMHRWFLANPLPDNAAYHPFAE